MLTRKRLNRLNLPAGAADAVLRLHEQELAALRDECAAYRRAADQADALSQERDALRSEVEELRGAREQAASLQQQLNDYRSEVEGAVRRSQLTQAVQAALLRGGANARALPLLMRAVELDTLSLTQPEEGDQPQLADEEALVAQLQGAYADFFAEPQQLGVPVLSPPVGLPGALTAGDLRAMEPEQINANWSVVRAALAAGQG